MRIALDCMGGDDYALTRNIEGAVQAAKDRSFEIILVGVKEKIEKELSNYGYEQLPFTIEKADETIAMDESPSSAFRKRKECSIGVALDLLKSKHADAVVTAGNTAVTMAMAVIQLGTLKHVERPAITAPLPAPFGFSILVDAGANADCKPQHLYQFALMGNIYARNVCGKTSPRIGLLSVGHEASKGNQVTKEAYKLLKTSSLNFAGNIEGRDIFTGKIDVIVCDGFVGNIVLKSTESFAEMLEELLYSELSRHWRGKLAGLLMKPVYKNFKKKLSHSDYGGAPLLGIDGVCVISHGSSSAKAIKNALFCAKEFVLHDLNKDIEKELTQRES